MFVVPGKYSILTGKGDSECVEVARRYALFDSGLGNINVIEINDGVLPPCCGFASRLPEMSVGSLAPVVCAKISSNISGDTIAAAVGVALPLDEKEAGVIMPFTDHCTADTATERLGKAIHKLFDDENLILGNIRIKSIDHKVICYGALIAACPFFKL